MAVATITLVVPAAAVSAEGSATSPEPFIVGGDPVTSPTGGAESIIVPVVSTSDVNPAFCGGVALGSMTVLTRAACVIGAAPSEVTVGTTSRSGDLRDYVAVGVAQIVLHPHAGAGAAWEGDVDLALLRLEAPIGFVPVEIAGGTVPSVGTAVNSYGWGATSDDPLPDATYPNLLRAASMEVATPVDELVILEDDADLCGRTTAGTSACIVGPDAVPCWFDWGGPVLVDGPWADADPLDESWTPPTLVGLIGWTLSPCDPALGFGVGMIPIAPYRNWIVGTMGDWGERLGGCYGDERGDSPFTSVVAGMALDGWTVPCWLEPGPTHNFSDVAPDRFFDEPVRWLSTNEITTGCTPTSFCPERGLTRAEAITFVWRMAGSPPADGAGFPDVIAEWQQVPVRWGRANGITTGTSPTTFSPDRPVTRAEFVTFLHRLIGSPDWGASPFTDLTASWQVQPVAWAWAEAMTVGCSPTSFCPNRPVTRGEAAAFLERFARWA